jgi:hypothetical protein
MVLWIGVAGADESPLLGAVQGLARAFPNLALALDLDLGLSKSKSKRTRAAIASGFRRFAGLPAVI